MTKSRARKQLYRTPSIIDSEMDWQFSPSEHHSSSEGESGDSDSTQTAAVVVPSKRSRRKTPPRAVSPKVAAPALNVPTVKLDYVTAIFSAVEMGKIISKRVPKNSSFQLQTDEPWDTLKAQLLVKITDALNPPIIDFTHYNVMIGIPRIVAKPGMPVTSEAEYTMFLNRIPQGAGKPKSFLANVTITQLDTGHDKENAPDAPDASKSKKKTKDNDQLPGNLKKIAFIKALHVRWKCEKRQPNCMGVHCYVFENGTHLALSHGILENWAFSMVSPPRLNVHVC